MSARFLAAADSALLVELAEEPGDAATAAVLALDAQLAATPPAGVVEVVPALRSVLVEYDPLRTSHARLRGDLEAMLRPGLAGTAAPPPSREHRIEVCYEGDAAPDLDTVSRVTGLPPAEVVRRHVAGRYRVAMLGNLPGLPYLLGLDPALQVPRRDDPRDAVPPGSVAVAGGLSCIYPSAGPGGWNLIGRTAAALFDPRRTPPALLAPGDVVLFAAVHHLRAEPPATQDGAAADDSGEGSPVLLVLEPGLLTTVQDLGRHGHQRIGVPVCGALDAELLRVANLLAGNPPGAAALEVTHSGPLLEARAGSVRVAVAGDCEVQRIAGDGTVTALTPWRSLVLRGGERLRVGRVRGGLRCVVAVEGGVDVAPVLGSRSTYLRGGFGGVQGRALRRGDVLPLQRGYAGHHPDVRLPASIVQDARLLEAGGACTVHAVPGPQDGAVDGASLDALFTTEMAVSARSDRVGLRLDGLRLRHRDAAEIVSDGCAPGSVQVPGSGQPIVLLADRGTTGGYAKVATVAGADLPRLARLRPGAGLRLERVDVAAAEALRRRREALLASLADALEPVSGR